MRVQRKAMMAMFGVVAALTVGASMAWACTGQTYMNVPVTTGAPGSPLSVEVVAGPRLAAGAVAVHWNSINGPVLASTTVGEGEGAVLQATVPQVAPGVYYLVLDTANGDLARSAFEVTGDVPLANVWASSSDRQPATDRRGAPTPMAGVVLLIGGLIGLSGFAFASLRRSRVAARSTIS